MSTQPMILGFVVRIDLGGHEWADAAVSGAIGLVAVPPVLLGTADGIWKEDKLDQG